MSTLSTKNRPLTTASGGLFADSAVLMALASCPALFIPFAENPFDPHKAVLFWILAAAAGAATAVTIRSDVRTFRLKNWQGVIVLWAVIAVTSIIVSTL